MEGGASSEMEFTDVEVAADSIDASAMFHLVMDILGILQDVNFEFDALHREYNDLEAVLAQTEMKAGRKRKVKYGIKRLQNLMNNITNTQTALKLVFSEIPHVEAVILVLGGGLARPQHIYELCFSHGHNAVSDACDFSKTKAGEAISRKAIRTLVSKGAGSASYGVL